MLRDLRNGKCDQMFFFIRIAWFCFIFIYNHCSAALLSFVEMRVVRHYYRKENMHIE